MAAPPTGPPLLQGPLLSAAMSPDASLLLLVAAAGAMLLQRTTPVAGAFDQALYCGNPLAPLQHEGVPDGAVEGTLPGSFTFADGACLRMVSDLCVLS